MIQATNIVKRFDDLEAPRRELDGKRRRNCQHRGHLVLETTLLQISGTLDLPDQGDVQIDGTSTKGFTRNQLSAFRNTNLDLFFNFIDCCLNSMHWKMS